MGHHIDEHGRFRSDLHEGLAPDKVIVSFKDQRAHRSLLQLADDYQSTDPGFSADIRTRVRSIREAP